MLEIHSRLDERYRTLRESRTGPVFFLEHGLSEDEVTDVFANVSHLLCAQPIESGWWRTNCLPLLVAATEVGYRYRGSGTDFWPVFEAKLGLRISAPDRHHIRDLFASAAKTYRGAQPPATPWADAFRFIVWPITHALVPLEFHRPLALTLANLRVNVSELDDDGLHRAIRIAASNSSARFATLLEDATLVVAVTRRLLGEDSAELCPQTMERIATDLASDQVARRAVAVARRRQRTVTQRKTPAASSGLQLPSIAGSLTIRRQDSSMTLHAAFPQMEADLQGKLRRALRRRRYAARLWGVSWPVPSEQLLSGLPFKLKLTSVPSEDAELFPDLDQVEIDQELRDVLATFELNIACPLLFAVDSDEEIGRRIHGPSISGHRKYWLLSRSGEGPSGYAALSDVGPYDCYLLDPAEEIARKVLRELGFHVHFGISVEFAGGPPLERDAPVPVFLIGDQRTVVPRRVPPEGLSVQLDDEQVHLLSDDVVTVLVERGDHTLRVSNGSEGRDYTFCGTPAPRPVPPTICSIEPRFGDLTVQAFLRGALEFAVESFAPLDGLELTVEIDASGRRLFATAPLGPLPCSVSSEQEPFATLLDDETRGLLARSPSLKLRLSVGNLCSHHVMLEQRVRPCWWQRGDDGTIALTSEVGMLPFGWVLATTPAAPPAPELDDAHEEARLLAPIGLEVSEHGGVAEFTTLCIAPSHARLGSPAIKKPILTRRRYAGNGALGLEDMVKSYLRWSLAESATFIAEIRRRQITGVLDGWLTEICCGEEWVRREATLGDIDPWEGLVLACDETGFGRDSYVELSREDEVEVTRIAVREIRLAFPDLWARVGPSSHLSEEDYEALDLACDRAYAKLADVYRCKGKGDVAAAIAEGQTGAAPDQWDAILGRVKSTAELQPLAEMLLPSDTAYRLMTIEPSMMALDDVTEELTEWARSARRAFAGSVPPSDTLKAILALWAEPEIAASLDWRGAIDVLLAERSVARAARYLALRSRRAGRGGLAR